MSAQFVVKPEVVLLDSLFEEVRTGRLRIPPFQRPFVWRPTDMLSLLDSVLNGYPIGSLLVWDTQNTRRSLDRFGPIEQPHLASRDSDVSLLLDGQHRLATLYGVLHVRGDIPDDDGERMWWAFYDLRRREFTYARWRPEPQHLPLRMLLRTTEFRRWTGEIAKQVNDQQLDELLTEADRVARVFKGYQVPINRIKGGELSGALEIFSRLNSKGRSLSPDQLAAALSYREKDGEVTFDLADRIDTILERIGNVGFRNLDRGTILRALVAVEGTPVHGSFGEAAARVVAGATATNKIAGLVDRAENALWKAAAFLADFVGVPGERVLPYATQLVMLARFFDERDPPTQAQVKALEAWFWATSFSSWYAGQNTTLLNDDLREMSAFARGELPTLRAIQEAPNAFPARFDLRSARVRAFLLATLIRKVPLDTDGQPVRVWEFFATQEGSAVPRLFPTVSTKVANRILLPNVTDARPRSRLLAMPPGDLRRKVLASHFIDDEAWEALLSQRQEDFLRRREQLLIAAERALMHEHGLLLPTREIENVALDADD